MMLWVCVTLDLHLISERHLIDLQVSNQLLLDKNGQVQARYRHHSLSLSC